MSVNVFLLILRNMKCTVRVVLLLSSIIMSVASNHGKKAMLWMIGEVSVEQWLRMRNTNEIVE